MNMSNDEKNDLIDKTYNILYWLNADRYHWNSVDLENLAEAFFAMGNVVSICRICFLLPIIGFVGPLQVMLERMIIDISKWIVIILIFFIAFACSLYLIFSYFEISLQQQQKALNQLSNDIEPQNTLIRNENLITDLFNETISTITYPVDMFNSTTNEINTCKETRDYDKIETVGEHPALYYFGQTFGSTILTTFFTLFGVIAEDGIPDRGYELITLTCYKPDPNSYSPGFDFFTSNLGFIIFGLFTFICVTVLIKTLIAMI